MLKNEKYCGDALYQKTYMTDALPRQCLRNRGERDQYYAANTHPAIIDRQSYEAVQMLLRRRNENHVQHTTKTSPLGGRFICARCGDGFRRKESGGRFVFACMTHTRDRNACDMLPIPENEVYRAFLRLYNNLRNHPEVLDFQIKKLTEIRSRQMLWSPVVVELNREISDILSQSHALSLLNKQGLILTFMSAFAQSESESISANVRWGKRQAMKEGKASINFRKLYGYYLDDEGNPQVDSDKAEAIRSIFDQYLQGASLRMIKLSLEGKAVPNPTGGAKWDISQIRSILGNEKYCGDVLMQKTFTQDCINKKVIKNTGQLPMYLIQNNHPAIVSREIYQAVQAEKTRRSASASPSKKMSSTGRSCYASKFALSERLVCGECGTLYRRCTWKRNGKTRIVWRCVSRLDYGSKYCHQSPTMDEEPLQRAIMTAINSIMDPKETFCRQITEAAVEETGILPDSTMTLGEINRRLEELEAEFNILLQQPDSAAKNAERFGSIANEMASLKEQREKIAARLRKDQTVQLHVHTMEAALDGMSYHMQQWDEEMIRQLVHTVKVISADHIKVFLYDGTEIDQIVGYGSSTID